METLTRDVPSSMNHLNTTNSSVSNVKHSYVQVYISIIYVQMIFDYHCIMNFKYLQINYYYFSYPKHI